MTGVPRLSLTAVLLSCVALVTAPSDGSAQSGFGTRPTAGIFGGVSFPRGDLSDEVDLGWHAGALAKLRVYRSIDARVDGTYTKFARKEITGGGATVNTNSSVLFGTFGAVLNMGADSAAYPGDNTVSPYLVGGLGIYRIDFDASCIGACTGFETEPENNFGVNIGFGATVPLAGIRTFAEGRYHRITRSDDVGGTRSMFLLSVGVKFR